MNASVVLWMTGALLCLAATAISIRTLAAGIGVFEINVIRTGGGLLVVLMPHPPADGFLIRPTTVLSMLSLTLAGLGSQYCLARALSAGTIGSVFAIDFLRVPLIALVGAFFYGETLDNHVFAGFALIVFGVLYGLTPAKAALRRDDGRQ